MHDFRHLQALCGDFDRAEVSYSRFMEECTRLIAAVIGCSRVSISLFEDLPTGRSLRCLSFYDSAKDQLTSRADETSSQVGAYFEALEQVGHVVADDARTHPATAGFFTGEIGTNSVRSLMSASFSLNGRLFGAFTCTHTQSTVWSPTQLANLKRMGARVSLTLANSSCSGDFDLPMQL